VLKCIRFVMLAAVTAIIVVAPLSAQQRSTVNSAALDAAVAGRPADRSVLNTAFSTPSAVVTAGRMGISPAQLAARVAALDDASAQQLADRVRAGGANLVISTTAIIIILLLVILLTR
jgi:hypothetical protein